MKRLAVALLLLTAIVSALVSVPANADPDPDVTLVHVKPDGSDYTGNPFCLDTVWDNGVPVAVNPARDCNNVVGQKHVIRTDGWSVSLVVESCIVENFSGANATILAQGRCGDVAEVIIRAEWNPAHNDEQCVVVDSSAPGETRISLTYDDGGMVYSTDPVMKEWDRLDDTVILKAPNVEAVTLPDSSTPLLLKDADGDDDRDAGDAHLMDHQGEIQAHAVIFDETIMRIRSAVGPVQLIDQVHGEHDVLIDLVTITLHQPTEGAVILAFIDSPHGCGYFTNPVAVDLDGDTINETDPGELDLGTAVVGISDWRGFFVGPQLWPASAQFTAEALAEAADHGLTSGMSNNGPIDQSLEFDWEGVHIDTVCEDQDTITFKVGYPDYVGSSPVFPVPEQVTMNWTTGLPVGGLAELPDAPGSSGRNYLTLAGLAGVALLALTAGAWYARRQRLG
jgi:hypothetical protein